MKIQEKKAMEEKLEVTNYAKEQGAIGMEYKVNNYGIDQALDDFAEETDKEFINRVKEVSDKVSEISGGKRKDINIIDEISRTHIYDTEVILKNLQLGKNGILNNPKATLYYKNLGSKHAVQPLEITSHIMKIEIEINIKTAIIDGYKGRDYNNKEEVAKKLLDDFEREYCFTTIGSAKYEVTDEAIKMVIEELDQSYPVFNFGDLGSEVDGYINSVHGFMEEANINRADVKFTFDNSILIISEQ